MPVKRSKNNNKENIPPRAAEVPELRTIEAELDRMKRMAVHVYEEMLYMRTVLTD